MVLPTRDLVSQVRETFEAVTKGTGLKVRTIITQIDTVGIRVYINTSFFHSCLLFFVRLQQQQVTTHLLKSRRKLWIIWMTGMAKCWVIYRNAIETLT